jgi:hypothetical protein
VRSNALEGRWGFESDARISPLDGYPNVDARRRPRSIRIGDHRTAELLMGSHLKAGADPTIRSWGCQGEHRRTSDGGRRSAVGLNRSHPFACGRSPSPNTARVLPTWGFSLDFFSYLPLAFRRLCRSRHPSVCWRSPALKGGIRRIPWTPPRTAQLQPQGSCYGPRPCPCPLTL